MSSLNPFRRQQPDRPTLRQRAASLKAGLSRFSRSAYPTSMPEAVTAAIPTAVTDAPVLSRIAQHRIARDRWTDSVLPADPAWRLRHGRDVSVEAVAAAEAERDAADDLVTAAWNSLFAAPPASSAELLALLRHARHYVDEDHAPDAAIELSGMVRAIGDAVEALRAQPLSDLDAGFGVSSPDRFLIDLAPTLLPLLDEVDVEWARVHVLYEQAVAACGKGPGPGMSEAAFHAYRDKFDAALTASGYRANWEAIQPLYERIEALVGPLMNVPVQTLEGLILKQRIGQTLSHFEDDAAKDLGRLAKAYRPGEPVSRSAQTQALPRLQGGIVDQIDFASAPMRELQAIRDVAERIGSVAYVHAWGPSCRARTHASGASDFNAVGKLVQWIGDALTEVESAAEEEVARRTPSDQDDRETRLSMLAATIIDNGGSDEIELFARELLAHAEAGRTRR